MSDNQPGGSARRNSSREQLRRKLILWLLLLIAATALLVFLLIHFNKAYRNAAPVQASQQTENKEESGTATLCAVGDICLSNKQLKNLRNPDGSYDFAGCFSQVTARLATADITVGNLEGNVCGEPYDADAFNYPSSLLTALQVSGFDLLLTANTRSLQNGISGLQSTLAAIRGAGMSPIGTYADAQEAEQSRGVTIRDINGIRFAFIGFTKGLNNMSLPAGSEHSVDLLYTDYDTNYSEVNKSAINDRVEAAKAQKPDVIVAMVHWGTENSYQVTDSQRSIASLLIDSGVNVILGSHTHQVESLEKRGDNCFIAYSLGDFLTASEEEEAQYGCILSLTFTRDASGKVKLTESSYAPTYTVTPAVAFDVRSYAVIDTVTAIELYESEYYDRISKSLYEELMKTVEALKKQTAIPEPDKE